MNTVLNETGTKEEDGNILFLSNLTEGDLVKGEKYGELAYEGTPVDYKPFWEGHYYSFSGEVIVTGRVTHGYTGLVVEVSDADIKKFPQYYFKSLNGWERDENTYNKIPLTIPDIYPESEEQVLRELYRQMESDVRVGEITVTIRVGGYGFVDNEKRIGFYMAVFEII